MSQFDWLTQISSQAASAPASGIAAVMKHGFGRSGIIPLWVGEGDQPTPAAVVETAGASMAGGETFYMPQPGIPELRQQLAHYHDDLYGGLFGAPFRPERFFVTGSGMQSIQLAIRMVAGVGDEVLVPTPAWPNFAAAVGVAGARAVEVPMDFATTGWSLDLGKLQAAITPRTRAVFLNSPSNPTGWTASAEVLASVLELCRANNLWIIADEVYGRFTYSAAKTTPSLHALITPEDRVMFVNTFSKNWAMTGWRVGWIEAPEALGPTIENLIQYSTSGVAVFMQRAAVMALQTGESFIAAQMDRSRQGRDIVIKGLSAIPGVSFAPPGAFYMFFAIDGVTDSTAFATELLQATNVGLAPGTAFGLVGQGFFRLCFARRHEDLHTACERMGDWLSHRPNPTTP